MFLKMRTSKARAMQSTLPIQRPVVGRVLLPIGDILFHETGEERPTTGHQRLRDEPQVGRRVHVVHMGEHRVGVEQIDGRRSGANGAHAAAIGVIALITDVQAGKAVPRCGQMPLRPGDEFRLNVDPVVVGNPTHMTADANRQAPGTTTPVQQPGLRGQPGHGFESLDIAHSRRDEGVVILEVRTTHPVLAWWKSVPTLSRTGLRCTFARVCRLTCASKHLLSLGAYHSSTGHPKQTHIFRGLGTLWEDDAVASALPWPDLTVYVAGHNGLVGSALWRALEGVGAGRLVGYRSAELDLRDREATFAAIAELKPDVVIDAAAKVGGIMANSTYPVEFLRDNMLIQANLMDASHAANVERLLFLGSSCIYPRHASQPIRESSLMTGPLEPTNQAYAMAKIAGIFAIEAYRTQYGRHWISAMPTNLYGPKDNFDLESSHVLPAFIRRFHEAKVASAPTVTVWGTGTPRREFLHVDDLAQACMVLLDSYDSPETINVGLGEDMPIRELAETVAEAVGFEGTIVWDTSKPDGMPRKLLDTTRINALGWHPTISLRDGVATTYQWFLANAA